MNKTKLSLIVMAAMASGSAVAAHTFVNDNGDSLTIDGRFEARYQDNGGDSDPVWNSGSSRFGLKGVKQLDNDWEGFGHAEWGYNSGSNGSEIYDRLLYAGVEHEKYGKIAAGTKQWSTFYDVAWFTDMGRTYGTRGSNVYNLTDWGISSGTGRAANSLTYRNNLGDLKYGFTYQTTRTGVELTGTGKGAPTATLKNGIGASVLYPLAPGLTVGAAYHQNEVTDLVGIDPSNMKDGDTARIGLLGLNYSTDNYFLGLTYHVADSWEVAGNSEFFDSRGGELYTHYHFDNGFRATFNANYMTETDGRAEGYERKTFTPGVEYHFTKNTFLLWAEYQFDEGKDKWNGSEFVNSDDKFSAGIRYYF
ncbi:porin [Photobacterium rosenbergii]|uniref:Porin n=1 Tax=Photobacterium rosenbergii TaxID=294936 RepID=A0A2T3NB08_9GAMM|nr:porin [Photobacterium rosenbergii]PSW10905.1 porin [Photobacterium rosenbergii]